MAPMGVVGVRLAVLGALSALVLWVPRVGSFTAQPPRRRLALRRPSSPSGTPPASREDAKQALLDAIHAFDQAQTRDGKEAVDFGVEGGELDKDSRRPRNLSEGWYAISEDVGKAGEKVLDAVDSLAQFNPTADPTRFFGTPEGLRCPLHGGWRLLFTTAADASFSSNSSRGDAMAMNVVNAVKGEITNIINFTPGEDGRPRALEQLRVKIKATALSDKRIGLVFRYAKARLTKFLFLPLFGRRITLTIPVPAPLISRIIFFFTRKEVPKPFFELLYLDGDMRVHRTDAGNLFIQKRPDWGTGALAA
uniref:Plastid lipid-associated protein/fibrillin conserved domain-containing protein n=1 Tax=Rhizochromulina marina TaxID=1034831 RepID=A0A7S2S6S8_9STRA|mmetsp:Transcript_25945/g.75620  ORF Transcript_25945/g.75620 Transcript_25945/m.75620 type:complete len:307 (+) Transcript_25945:75-995(+)